FLFRKGDLRGAATELESVWRADPLNQRAALWLARTYTADGRSIDARRVYDRLIQGLGRSGTLDPLVFLAATDLDVAAGQHGGASARLGRVPAPLSQRAEVLTARGALAQAQGDDGRAEREYMAALSSNPEATEP